MDDKWSEMMITVENILTVQVCTGEVMGDGWSEMMITVNDYSNSIGEQAAISNLTVPYVALKTLDTLNRHFVGSWLINVYID